MVIVSRSEGSGKTITTTARVFFRNRDLAEPAGPASGVAGAVLVLISRSRMKAQGLASSKVICIGLCAMARMIIINLRLVTHFKFNYGSGPENGHETALELVPGANCG